MTNRRSDVLRYLDRALRPKAAAIRVLSAQTAATNQLVTAMRQELAEISRKIDQARPAAEPAGDLVGSVVDNRPPENSQYDQWTIEVIRRALSGGGVGIDVGAHHGDILTEIVAAAPDSRHYAFEPIPYLAVELEKKFPGVRVHQLALAAEAGESTFHHVVTNPAYSGIKERHYDRPDEQVELIRVEISRLDDLVDPADEIRLIKIDVEGGELGVLQGAAKVLEHNRPIVIFECGLGGSDHYGTSPEQVFREFARHGMGITLLPRWLAGDSHRFSLQEFGYQFYSGENYYFIADPIPAG